MNVGDTAKIMKAGKYKQSLTLFTIKRTMKDLLLLIAKIIQIKLVLMIVKEVLKIRVLTLQQISKRWWTHFLWMLKMLDHLIQISAIVVIMTRNNTLLNNLEYQTIKNSHQVKDSLKRTS